ncbi:MAG: PDZ domain-containing protein [Actinobacteria bacterium]|nr:PDZ domain-containing protein [Actinomycetota bacterium]
MPLLLAALVAGVLTFVRLPYFAYRPGTVNALTDRIVVTLGDRFEPEGEVFFTTVRQDSSVNGWEYIEAFFNGDIVLYGEDAVLGQRSRDENTAFNLELMQVSKSTAVAVAFRHLGIDPYEATGVGMAGVEGPAQGLLTTDDVIVAVDGQAVLTADALVEEIRGRSPGQVVSLGVESIDGASSRTVEVALGARADDLTTAFLGVRVQTRWEDVEDLPIDVRIETGRVGGNSAGLALTLAILDLVTPGEMTGGLDVATTGTIGFDGSVGPIGGVVQKTIAARDAGVDLFLVPANEYEAASRHAGDLRVEPVATLEDALVVLAELGGNAQELALP